MAGKSTCCGCSSTSGTTTSESLLSIVTFCPSANDKFFLVRGSVTYKISYKDLLSCHNSSVGLRFTSVNTRITSVHSTVSSRITSVANVIKPYDLVFFQASVAEPNEKVFVYNNQRTATIPANFSGSKATLETAPSTTSITYNLYKVEASVTAQLGRLKFNPNKKTGIFSTTVQTSLSAGARLIFRAPSSSYGAKDLAMTLLMTVRV